MIKKLFLPNSPGKLELARHPLTRPLLPCLHERGQPFRIQLCRTEEVHMIRHDDITPDRPAVVFACPLPFVDQNLYHFFRDKNRPPFESARGNEINRRIDPDALEPAEMLMHRICCSRYGSCRRTRNSSMAGITDPGYSTLCS